MWCNQDGMAWSGIHIPAVYLEMGSGVQEQKDIVFDSVHSREVKGVGMACRTAAAHNVEHGWPPWRYS